MMMAMYIAAAVLVLSLITKTKKEKPKENSPKIGTIPLVLLALLLSLVQTVKNKITKMRTNKENLVKVETKEESKIVPKVEPKIEPKKEEKIVAKKATTKSYDEMTRAEKIDYLKKTREFLVRQKEITKAPTIVPTKVPTKNSGGKVLKKTMR